MDQKTRPISPQRGQTQNAHNFPNSSTLVSAVSTGTLALATRVLESAFEDAMLTRPGNCKINGANRTNRANLYNTRLQQQAIDWLLTDPQDIKTKQERHSIENIGMSIGFVCQVIGLDVDAVQDAVRRQYNKRRRLQAVQENEERRNREMEVFDAQTYKRINT